MKRSIIDVADIVAFAAVVKAAFEEKEVKAEINISLSELLKLKRSMEDPEAAKREVAKQTMMVIKNLPKFADCPQMKPDLNKFAKAVLMPYRTAIEMEVVPHMAWNRETFNAEFGTNINEKNWGRWVNGNEGFGYTSQETRFLEKAYAQFVIGF